MAEKRKTGSNPLNTFLSQIPDYVGNEDDSKQSKTETKSESETKAKTKTKSESKQETKPKSNVKTKSETKTKPITEAKTNTIAKVKTKTQPETIADTQTFPHAKTFASDIKERAYAQSELQRFEDSRKRQTYWLDRDTIAMISELAERSGCNKYHVVSAGVQMLYEYVFDNTQDEELQ